MNRLYTSGDFSSSCSSESDDGSSTDDECHEKSLSIGRTTDKRDANGCGAAAAAARKSISQNILFKLQNREVRRICECHSVVDAVARFRS